MVFLGLASAFSSTVLYSLRFALIKKLATVPKLQLNLYYRLAATPFLLILIAFSSPLVISSPILLLYLLFLFFQLWFSRLQTSIYHTQPLSTVESLSFLEVIFSSVLGVIFLKDRLGLNHFVVIGFNSALLYYLYHSNQKTSSTSFPFSILIYYFITSIIGLFNKYLILHSSPLTLVTLTSFGLIIGYLLVLCYYRRPLIIPLPKHSLLSIITIGFFAISAFFLVSVAYQHLPLGVVAIISSTKSLFSLFLSRQTFGETNLFPKLAVSIASILVMPLLFIN